MSVDFNESWWARLGRQAWDLGLLPRLGMVLGGNGALVEDLEGEHFCIREFGSHRKLPLDAVRRLFWPDFRASATMGELEAFGRSQLGSGTMAFEVGPNRWTMIRVRRLDQWPTVLLSEGRYGDVGACAAQAWIAAMQEDRRSWSS